MPFTIPNEADAFHQDQAEPDRVDIDILVAGYAGTGVVSGCAVTAQGSPDMTAAVAVGVVAVAGVTAAVTAGNVTVGTADGTNPRIDLITVNSSGTKACTAGTAAANPVFPAIPASSVVLAAVYVPASDTAIASNQIVDKRVMIGYEFDSRVTFSNADHSMAASTSYLAQVGTLSAARTVTLPAANAVPAGHHVTVTDESGTATATNYIAITRAGSDTIVDPGNLNTTKSYTTLGSVTTFIKGPDSRQLRSDGTSKWMVVEAGTRRPFCWWQHTADVAIPDSLWTPLPWNACYPSSVSGSATGSDEFGITPNLQGTSTTIAVASNGAALPQATINVASTTGFTSAGYLVITGPPGAGDDTIVTYTGVTATSFTGCNSAYRGTGVGISTGTLATSQVVRQANVEWTYPTGYLWNLIAEVAFDSIATTAYIAVRFRAIDNFFNFPIATTHHSGINITGQHAQLVLQPGIAPNGPGRIEVFQNSGGVKLSKVDSIQAPSLMQAFMSSR